jgi:natural product precursor
MKTLKRLNINNERLLEDNELKTLRGGYDFAACSCRISGIVCEEQFVENCGDNYGSCIQYCQIYCPNYTEAICVGW